MISSYDKYFINKFLYEQKNLILSGKFFWARKIKMFFFSFIALPFVLFARLIYPILKIRFANLHTRNIGHLTRESDLYYYEKRAGFEPSAVDIWGYDNFISNEYFLNKLKASNLFLIFKDFGLACFILNRLIPGGGENEFAGNGHDWRGVSVTSKPLFVLSEEEEKKASEKLMTIGFEPDKDFVCFYGRDFAYDVIVREQEARTKLPLADNRNADIKTYIGAMKKVVDNGYSSIKVGSHSYTKIDNISGVIDYTHSGIRSDFLDIYLLSKCKLFVGSDSGLSSVPIFFRRPLFIPNALSVIEFYVFMTPESMCIPKKLYSYKLNRYLYFSEMFNLLINGRENMRDKIRVGELKYIDNTEMEITNSTQEMIEKIDNIWKTREDEKALEEKYWDIIKKSKIGFEYIKKETRHRRKDEEIPDVDFVKFVRETMKVRLSYTFLKSNIDLLK